jgi:putative ABC transport system permease protein
MTWWRRVISRRRLETELDAELREHFDRLVADFKRAGHGDGDARRLARLEFGGLDQVKEACRDERGTQWVEETAQDIRYGLRGFGKNPGFATVAVLTLALGVGANLAIFNLVDALLLRPLPVPDASTLVSLTRWGKGGSWGASFSYPQIQQLSERSDLFTSLCGIGTGTVYVGPPDALEPAGAAWVSGGYFDTLRLTPFAGRLLTMADATAAAAPAAVLSHSYWNRKFAGDRRAVGRTLMIEGQQVPIVGITPEGFGGATIGERADITMAVHARAVLQPENSGVTGEGWRWLRVLARPSSSLTRPELQARLDVAWAQLVERNLSPKASPEARDRARSVTVTIEPGEAGISQLRGSLQRPLVVAWSLVTLVLLVACVNVANLLLARGAARAREIALRLAIGAGRGRIIRQLLVESALLAAAGITVGLLLAWLSSAALVDVMAARIGGPEGSIIDLNIAPNWRLVSVSILVGTAMTVLFGLLPAWRASSIAPGVTSTSSRVAESHGRLASALIVAQVSLSLVLVIGAGLFMRSLSNLRALDRGFTPGTVLLATVDPSRAGLSSPALQTFNQSLLAAVEQLPGVTAVSAGVVTPLEGGGMSQSMTVNGVSSGLEEVYFNIIAPRYFDVLGTPLIAGREFTASDDERAPAVGIVNAAFVRKYLTEGSPLGQHVKMSGATREMEIVGVVKDAAYETLRAPAPPTVYASYLQTKGRPMTLLVDAHAPIAGVATALRGAIQPLTPAKPVRMRTFASQLEDSLFNDRLMMWLTSIFGLLALGLAAVGLYGLMSYTVVTRTREIGVRLALGARPVRVVRMVLGKALAMVALGILIGLPAAWLLSRLVAQLVFGLNPTDTPTILVAVAVLALVGIASAGIPARRAAMVDPVMSIHVE